ncbi:thiamine diphosphokinase [Virgibacillus siamensis]|uniref:thiamine diphosphokinase n=1 Tax=Virgibacillus siamensis TaxID=480071 RepID=UPI0009868238|nr:thiamine diphosphokinase [Virgibacillus siamensis]
MLTVGIVGNGPIEHIPLLKSYDSVDVWIGADRGAITIIENECKPAYAVGDFDSISVREKAAIKQRAENFLEFPVEKDQTDLELALWKAFELHPNCIYMFGVTGGRLDHAMINMQLLYQVLNRDIKGIIVDRQNQLELADPGEHVIVKHDQYPNVSFVPFTPDIKGLTLTGFYYPLRDQTISWGSTLCISNKLLSKSGTFSFKEGILLVIKSRDAETDAIPR